MISGKIKLWDEDRVTIAECDVPVDTSYMQSTDAFVARCWRLADEMALHLTPSDDWGVEMVITCDFTEEKNSGQD